MPNKDTSIYKRFSACSPRASSKSHTYCTGSCTGYQSDNSKETEPLEVTYRCNCPGHNTGLCGSIQGDLFKPNTIGKPLPAESKQGKLF